MILRLDDEYNIIEAITVGGDPNAEGFCEVLAVPPDILGDIFSYKYIDGQFVRRDNVDDSLLQEVRSIKIEFLNKTCHTLIEGVSMLVMIIIHSQAKTKSICQS